MIFLAFATLCVPISKATGATRGLPAPSFVISPVTDFRLDNVRDVRVAHVLHSESYWMAMLNPDSKPHYFNRTASWNLDLDKRQAFYAFCETFVLSQRRILGLLSADHMHHVDSGALWLNLRGYKLELTGTIEVIAATLPQSLRDGFFQPWLAGIDKAYDKLHEMVIGHVTGDHSAGAFEAPLAHALDYTQLQSLVWPSLVDAMLVMEDNPELVSRLGGWKLHGEMGPLRFHALARLCQQQQQSAISNQQSAISNQQSAISNQQSHDRREHGGEQLGGSAVRLVELGVAKGVTAAYVLEHCPGVHYLGVDPHLTFEVQHNLTKVARRAGSRAYFSKATSLEAALSGDLARLGWHRHVDVLFVDTEKHHGAAYRDILLWAPRVRASGGVVAGHDFASFWMGTAMAVLELAPDDVVLHFGPDHTWWWYT